MCVGGGVVERGRGDIVRGLSTTWIALVGVDVKQRRRWIGCLELWPSRDVSDEG